jgi:hypothetical protein
VSEQPPIEPGPFSPPPPSPPPRPPGLPWEEPNAGLGSIVPTAVAFVTRPSSAFAQMSLTVDLVRPLAYFVACALAAAVMSQLWSYLMFDTMLGIVRSLMGPQFEKIQPFMQRPGGLQLVVGLLITPLVWLIVLFIWSGIVHLTLTLLGGAARGFGATLRVMCYAQTSQVAVIFPLFGGLVSFVWRLVLEIIGLSQAHKTEPWKAALAIFLPLLLCCLCIIAGAVAFGAALAQALQNMK